jgi:hypothetical protein
MNAESSDISEFEFKNPNPRMSGATTCGLLPLELHPMGTSRGNDFVALHNDQGGSATHHFGIGDLGFKERSRHALSLIENPKSKIQN